ncbi:DNA directed RNA polymerase III subunit RPC3 [Fasciola hepatica]|uniref:DNA-directed RNA polymerase III subunit RPC3 n=1 Tax=Fasciola hepatica TaxID=6192 RepID=A0A4E0R4J6_FASHE|nr:DNA directed RNA polymerase III subunit RPC3 [Fasciola hepatica]
MSVTAAKYAQFILSENFGPTAASVTRLMRTKGPVLLLEIIRDCSDLTAQHIGRCLKSLIRHMLLRQRHSTNLKYELNYPLVFCIPRFPLFMQLVLHFYGQTAKELVFHLFIIGRAAVSDLLMRCLSSLDKSEDESKRHEYVESLGNTLDTLIRTGVLEVLVPNEEQPQECQDKQSGPNKDVIPASGSKVWNFSKNEICEALHTYLSTGKKPWTGKYIKESDSKRARLSSEAPTLWDHVVYPNVSVFEAMWRDRLIFQLARERLGETCGNLMSHLLCIAAAARRSTTITSVASGSVSRNEVMRSMRTVPEFFDSYLSLLVEDEIGFLVQEPNVGGFMYICPYKQVIKQLLTKHAEHVIRVLFQNSGLRIFRLLLCGPLNHEELERRVLLPQKDFRRTLPRMISAGYIATTELSKSKDYTSETIICLYSVNLTRVAYLLIELSQHSALRIAVRSKHEFELKKRLVEQRYRVENLIEKHQAKMAILENSANTNNATDNADDVESLTQHRESLESLKSSITPAEQKQLNSLISTLAKLNSCEQEAHITWFVSELYLRLHT